MRETSALPLTDEQEKALQEFANLHGRFWKLKLMNLWIRGEDKGLLRQVRNDYGPVWLRTKCKIKPQQEGKQHG